MVCYVQHAIEMKLSFYEDTTVSKTFFVVYLFNLIDSWEPPLHITLFFLSQQIRR